VRLRLLGERPRLFLALYAPTLIAVAIDLLVRPRDLARLEGGMRAVYVLSAIGGSGLWAAALWVACRLAAARSAGARAALAVLFGGVFLPFAVVAYGGQVLYYHAFHTYISRDTVRLGIRLRSTVGAWLRAWPLGSAAAVVLGVFATALVFVLVRRASPSVARTLPVLPGLGLAISLYCYGADFLETRTLQAAPPDACFLHGAVYAARMALLHRDAPPMGVTLRAPDPLPPLAPAAHRPNVVVVLSESVRADALCSERAAGCDAPFLDEAAPDRVALGKLTTQSPGTFTASVVLWTGLPPDTDFTTFHRAPTLWELARAVGYRTAYVAAQNLSFQDLVMFVERAGIDVLVGADQLGGVPDDVHLGAPDENATARALDFVRGVPPGTPYFLLVHLSNTHWPYRVDPALQPFAPHDADPAADVEELHNHYRNSVRLQERTVAAFVRALRSTPGWDDTALIFLSDHGEAFRERGQLYHLHWIFDEETRIPGFLLAGPRAIDAAQREALAGYAGKRTYSQDVHATVVDLLGLLDQRDALPFADRMTGRSLLRPRPPSDVTAAMTTQSGVWENDSPCFGVRRGEILVVGTETRPFQCYSGYGDPAMRHPLPASRCAALVEVARRRFPQVKADPSAADAR
jgi:hypothetical protein